MNLFTLQDIIECNIKALETSDHYSDEWWLYVAAMLRDENYLIEFGNNQLNT